MKIELEYPIVFILPKKKGGSIDILSKWFLELIVINVNKNIISTIDLFYNSVLNEELIIKFVELLKDKELKELKSKILFNLEITRLTENFEYSPVLFECGYYFYFNTKLDIYKYVSIPIPANNVKNAKILFLQKNFNGVFEEFIDNVFFKLNIDYYLPDNIFNSMKNSNMIFEYLNKLKEIKNRDLILSLQYEDIWGRKFNLTI